MPRTPDEIMDDFDRGDRQTSVPMRDVLWEIIEDVCSSYEVAIMATLELIIPGQAREVERVVSTEVRDYLSNHYGDD